MTQFELERIIQSIQPLDEEKMREAAAHLDNLTKPPGSLGKLETIARQTAGITGEKISSFVKKAVIVMAGDHGVCAEGVSAYPQEVTAQMVLNFLSGGAAVNVLARHAGADVVCVDVGVRQDIEHPLLLSRKIRKGTGNISREAAMSREEALQAIGAGITVVDDLAAEGYALFATGDMGIGNTTPSAALLAVFTGLNPEEAVGRGTGIDEITLQLKAEVVKSAIRMNEPDPADPLDVLAKVGGLEIAGLVGVILGCAARRCPVVIDGFISSAAALVAGKIAPLSTRYMIASHLSQERGHRRLLEHLELSPLLHMDMRLGEGTGAVLCFSFIDAAMKIMQEMATFDSAGVSRS